MSERFGEYELIKKIATGGMAEIHLARIGGVEGFTRRVVVKRMLPQLAVRPDFVQMFLDEARLAANLVHPNIVQVFNLGQVDGAYFMAMELIDGPHLGALFAHSLRQRRPLPVELCVFIVARAADGLHYAHEQRDPATGSPLNIVHRDISPQNVLVSRHGDVKVTDFGVAKAETQQSKTRTGIIKGKVSYMSPEQCLGEPVDRRTDVFALGVVLYELLTRRRLYREKSDLLVMQRITGEEITPPSSLNPTVDPELDRIATTTLTKAREDRFRSAADLSEALDVWLATQGHADCRAQLQRWMESHASDLGIGVSEQEAVDSSPGTPAWERTSASDLAAMVDDGEEGTVSTPALDPARDSLSGKHRAVHTDDIDISTSRIQTLIEGAVSSDVQPGATDTQLFRAPPPDDDLAGPPTTAVHGLDIPSSVMESPRANARKIAPLAAGFALLVIVGAAAATVMMSGGDEAASQSVIVEPAGPRPKVVEPTVDAVAASATEGEKAPEEPVEEKPEPRAEATTKLTVATSPSGVPVFVGGEPQGNSPVELELKLEGSGEVQVSAYFPDQPPVVRKLKLEKEQQNEITLVAKVKTRVTSEPPGAQLYLDRKNLGTTPRDDLFLTPGESVSLSLRKDGYRTWSQQLVPDRGKPLEVRAVLERAPSPSSTSSAKVAPPQAPTYGSLQVNSKPWGIVYVDGKRMGPSPVNVPKVRTGSRKVRIVNNDDAFGFQKTVTVEVKKNQQATVGFVFEKKGDSYELVRLVQ